MAKPGRTRPRFEFDRTWALRIALVLVVVAGVVLIGRVSSMLFDSGGKRLQRYEQQVEGQRSHEAPASRAASPP